MSEAKEEVNLPATQLSAFGSVQHFETVQRMANLLSQSDIVPDIYKTKVGNCLIALEISQRTGSGVIAVMQNLHIIKGRPSWSSSYIIAAINTCGRFNELEFEITDKGMEEISYDVIEWVGPKGHATKKTTTKTEKVHNMECYAYTTSKRSGRTLKGSAVSIKMAVAEGWYGKDGSKWQTMPDQMLMYRAAAFFGRVYAPELMMGMQTREEIEDFVGPENAVDITPKRSATAEEISKKFLGTEPAREAAPVTMPKAAGIQPEPSVPKKPFNFVSASEQPSFEPAEPKVFRRSYHDDEQEAGKNNV